jgi:prevent-host-death family protein
MYVRAMIAVAVDMDSMPASEARAKLPELLTRVEDGDVITITRHGRAIAVLVSPDAWHRRSRAGVLEEAQQVRDLLGAARAVPLPAGPGLAADYAEELVREVRAGRDAG